MRYLFILLLLPFLAGCGEEKQEYKVTVWIGNSYVSYSDTLSRSDIYNEVNSYLDDSFGGQHWFSTGNGRSYIRPDRIDSITFHPISEVSND